MLATHSLEIEIVGPILTRDSGDAAAGIDAPVARDHAGRLMIAGSHVLGKVRHALRELLKIEAAANSSAHIPTNAMSWFGGEGDEVEGRNQRRRIFVSDLVVKHTAETGQRQQTRTRIKLDPERGAVEDGALQTIETPVSIGELLTFEGEVDVIGQPDELEVMILAVRFALAWTTQLGGLRTIGFGRINRVEIADKIKRPRLAVQSSGGQTTNRLEIALEIRDPLCIADTRNSGNTFVSSDVIPGGVLKGALANLVLAGAGFSGGGDLTESARFPALSRHYSKLRFQHFFPQRDGTPTRPHHWPKSLVAIPGKPDTLADAALWEGPHVAVAQSGGLAPAFFRDWKADSFTVASRWSGWPQLSRTLRVRTAIDPDELRAKTSQLFAYDMIEPHGHCWIGSVSLEDVPDNERSEVVREFLEAVSVGIPGVGRSQAMAQLTFARLAPPLEWAKNEDGLAILTLQTAALLRSPTGRYGEAIDRLSGGTLRLVRHFASERLSGASFMAARFFKSKPYRPWLLTEPGSVFVVEVGVGGDSVIEGWLTGGIGLSPYVRYFYGLGEAPESELWRDCPFLPHNGYGEIAVDLPYHRRAPA